MRCKISSSRELLIQVRTQWVRDRRVFLEYLTEPEAIDFAYPGNDLRLYLDNTLGHRTADYIQEALKEIRSSLCYLAPKIR